MSEDRRQRRVAIGAIGVTLLFHGALLAGLAIAGEWRVLRFLANAIVQLDVALMLCWVVWQAVTVPTKWPLATLISPDRPGILYAGFLRVLDRVIVVSPPGPRLDFSDPRERFETIVYRLMFVFALVLGLAVLMPEGWNQIYVMLVSLVGFVGVALAVGGRALQHRRTKGTTLATVAS